MTNTRQPQWSEPIANLDEFRDLAGRIEHPFGDLPRPEGRLHAVLGGARMGKTSLLKVLPAWLLKEPIRSGQRLAPTCIHYRRDEGDLDSPQAFLTRLIKELREGLRKLGLCTIAESNFEPYFRGGSPAEGFRDALAFLLDQVREASSDDGLPLGEVRLVGLVDDAEEVARCLWAPDLFCELRDLYAREELVRRRLDLVMVGGDRLARYFESDAPWADGNRLFLRPMTPKVVSIWLQEASEGQLTPPVAQAIAAESGGQPFLVSFFVHEIRSQAERRRGWDRLPPDVVDRLVGLFVQQQQQVLAAWTHSLQRADPRNVTWSTYRLLAQARGTGLDVNDIEDQLWDLGLQADVEQTLERLMWQGVVAPAPDDPYRYVAAGVFRRYFQQQEQQPAIKFTAQPAAWQVPTIGRSHRSQLVPEYDDFSLRLSAEGDGYQVRVSSLAGETRSEFHNPLPHTEQTAIWQRVSEGIFEPGELEDVGGRLFRAIFHDDVLGLFRNAWARAHRERLGLRIKLILEPPELHGLPWEFLYDEGQQDFVALLNKMPLVRYVEQPRPIPDFEPTDRLRLLFLVASPRDQVPLDVDREVEIIQTALEPWRAKGWLEYKIAKRPEADTQSLQRLLRKEDYHIFHFSGHGAFDAAKEQGVLLLEGADRCSEPLTARQLARFLRDERDIRLTFLNACETAVAPETAPFASVAGTLVQAGVPAVVATQYAMSDDAAVNFACEFYQALADFYPLEAAVAEGRRAIDLISEENYEWGIPVLYLRAQHGRMFQ
jgi:hypothetical protein